MKNNSLNQKLGIWAIVVALILFVPFITKAPWTLLDYVFAGIVLYSLFMIYTIATHKTKKTIYRALTAVVLLTVLILIWAWAVA